MICRGIFTFLTFSFIPIALASDPSTALQGTTTCSASVKPLARTDAFSAEDSSKLPLTISADSVTGKHDQNLEFSGAVSISQGERQLSAERASLDRTSSTLSAEGEVHYQDSVIDVLASELTSSSVTNSVELHDSAYQMLTDASRGDAKSIQIQQNEKQFILQEGTFTTCPQGDDSWQLSAKTIQLNGEDEWGEAYQSTIKIAGIPILWVPYMTFPLSNKRKSGLLFPTLSSSSNNGIDYTQPYYWNVKENLDATITPRIMSRRGTQLASELRYLRPEQYNQLNLEFLSSDQVVAHADKRYLAYWLHQGHFGSNWHSYLEYTKVSDDNYFNDFGSSVAGKTDNRLEQTATLSYLSEDFDADISLSEFEIFGNYDEVYRQVPRISMTYRIPQFSDYVNSGIYSETVRFSSPDLSKPNATRVHIEPNVAYNWRTPSSEISAEAKLYHTYYQQSHHSGQLDDSVTRTIPSFRVAGQLNFDRPTEWFGHSFTQTLEPKVQYLITQYQNQDRIGIYDTVAMRDDVYGLFRDRRFSGLDRIADTNQVTVGLTSRLLNANNQESVKLSIGQVFYLSSSAVIEDLTNSATQKASAFAMIFDAFQGDFNLHSEYQYSFERSQTENSNILLNYIPGAGKLAQLSFHYSPEPFDFNETYEGASSESQQISQLGLVASWPISDKLLMVGTHYRDINLNRSIESLLGFQYQSCCWAISLLYQRSLNTNFPDKTGQLVGRDEFDAGFKLQFEIKGLGGSSSYSGQKTMIDKSLFGYRRNYYLNN